MSKANDNLFSHISSTQSYSLEQMGICPSTSFLRRILKNKLLCLWYLSLSSVHLLWATSSAFSYVFILRQDFTNFPRLGLIWSPIASGLQSSKMIGVCHSNQDYLSLSCFRDFLYIIFVVLCLVYFLNTASSRSIHVIKNEEVLCFSWLNSTVSYVRSWIQIHTQFFFICSSVITFKLILKLGHCE